MLVKLVLFNMIRAPPIPLIFENSKIRRVIVSKKYFININGKKIPVSEEVYREYMRPVWRENKSNSRNNKRKDKYSRLDNKCSLDEKRKDLIGDIAVDKMMLETLLKALPKLEYNEQQLIDRLFLQQKTEREVATEIGISHQAVHKRLTKIIGKIRKLFN